LVFAMTTRTDLQCWSWRIWPNDRVASSDLEPHRLK
jgi:hypothetical protein